MARDTGKDRDSRYNEDMEDAMDDMGGKKSRRFSSGNRKKECRFTSGEEDPAQINYKNPKFLAGYMTEHGKIVPRRVTGNCATIQRKLSTEIKRARALALIGYTSVGPHSS
jgi:small subunit ribosomal protein S18